MKKNLKTKAIILSTVVCAAFMISLQYSNSSKALLLKSNVEAISESSYANDPGGYITLSYCYLSFRYANGYRGVYKCKGGTTIVESGSHYPSTLIIYECSEEIEDHMPRLSSSYGYCYFPHF